jgi:hypothetical protein
MADLSAISGVGPAKLGNDVSDAIHAALKRGMETDEACCVVLAVAADYARMEYGPAYLHELAAVILRRNEAPSPENIGHG